MKMLKKRHIKIEKNISANIGDISFSLLAFYNCFAKQNKEVFFSSICIYSI